MMAEGNACTTKTGLFGEGTGKGVGRERGGESTHIGVGDSPLQDGGCNEKVEVLGVGAVLSDIGVIAMPG